MQRDTEDEGQDAAMNGSSSDAVCLCSSLLKQASAHMAIAVQQHLRDILVRANVVMSFLLCEKVHLIIPVLE